MPEGLRYSTGLKCYGSSRVRKWLTMFITVLTRFHVLHARF